MTKAGPRVLPVYVVLPPRTLLLDVAGPVEVLRRANVEQDGLRFVVRYVGPAASLLTSIGLTVTGIEPLPQALPDEAMVMVVGSVEQMLGEQMLGDGGPDAAETEGGNQAIVDWLRRSVGPGHRLVSICAGALLAGRAGLLDGRPCTTHYSDCETLARLAPLARVLENRLYVEDGLVATSAGVTAGIDLMLHLVAEMVGPAVALAAARALVVYLRRAGGDPQLSAWLEGRNHVHPAVHRVQDAIAADPAHPWTQESLADVAGASPRHLSRLFNDHTGMTLPDYVNRLRVALAAQLLSHTRLDMESVAERAGFASTRQMRRVWRVYHPTSPKAARGLGNA
ncbi:GlxA family transcriptional regulator [Nitrospirillum viridazoti]|uniref:AraC family transcriptional regulator n=1 Tax=Nitrospirillum viridazoti CBAmc TaxID=1441467 RepID=A0A248JVS5_9PROT|nr:helix-turn-helix domain-containing protein [Nitrospirillum amazonense]ASG22827.1 AraC family transcriptional regulator [Nitrospirillum amazonense CBAmc]TWB33711.1 AraC family transcriptional regulator with amidase-like domain [Nitrospirillum amazonense]